MTLTPTKAHDQFMPLLARIPHSLRKYGHNDIQLVFTDNVRGDKPELERVLPSLLCNVTPIPSSSLQPLAIPPAWDINILSSTYQINHRINSIMEDLNADESDTAAHVQVAMDMEWSVDREHGIHGRVALISMTYKQSVLLIPVSRIAAT